MIKLEIEDFCQDCEHFEAVVAKKYEIGKGYIQTEITCKGLEDCKYAKNIYQEIKRQNKYLDEYLEEISKENKEVNA